MTIQWSKYYLIALLLSFGGNIFYAQQTEKTIGVTELFNLVKENHPSLKPYRDDVSIAEQNTKIARNQLLPNLSAGLSAYYIGDALLIDKDLSSAKRVKMPHFGNSLSADASQLIWSGNSVRNSIKVKTLQEGLAALNYESNEQSIKLLVLSYYLDLYKSYNQEEVYLQNIELAEKRLTNINKFYKQGMVTKNDVIRGELQLSNLKLSLQVLKNDQQILNKQLTVATGLNENTKIIPDRSILASPPVVGSYEVYEDMIRNNPAYVRSQKNIDIYELTGKITKAQMLPTISAFASNSLQRPITTVSPVVDMYTNGWSAGLSLNFNIDALYKTPKQYRLNHLEKEKAINQSNDLFNQINIAVNSAYIKYNESLTQNKTLKVNTELTAENYRIMESKYNNQLAILLDLIDASNAKIDAELDFANSEINIVYAYFKLLKETGTL